MTILNSLLYSVVYIYNCIMRYLYYKRKPTYAFRIKKYNNGMAELILYKDVYLVVNESAFFNMCMFDMVNHPEEYEDAFYYVNDCKYFISTFQPVWTYTELYNFVKIAKERGDISVMTDYVIRIESRDIKKVLKKIKG